MVLLHYKCMLKLCRILLSSLLLLGLYSGVDVKDVEAASRKVRVGYFIMPSYQEVDENGNRSGYGYDFLQKLKLYNDWDYEYVAVNSYSEALKALEEGRVDLVTSTTKNPQRTKIFAFSRKPIGSSSTIITIDSSNENLSTGDYSNYNGIKIGMTKGNSRNASLEAFAREHSFTYVPVYYNNNLEMAAALQEGSIDAAVSSNLRLVKDEHILEIFDSRDFYVVTRMQDESLMAEVNRAIDRIYVQEPNWERSLWEAHYGVVKDEIVAVTATERKYLDSLRKSGKPIKVLINPKQKPYAYLEDGKLVGVYKDMVDNFASRFNLKCELLPAKSSSEYMDMLRSGQVDIVMGFIHNHSLAENFGYVITEPFYEIDMALMTKSTHEGEIKTVAVNRHAEYRLKPFLKEINLNNVQIIEFDTSEDCIYAVAEEKCDATITNMDSCRIYTLKYPQWHITYTPLKTVQETCVAVSSKMDRRLVSVINKATNSVERTTVTKLVHGYVLRDASRKDIYAYLYDNSQLAIVALFCAMLFIAAVIYIVSRRKFVHTIQAQNQELEAGRQAIREALDRAEHANRAKTNFLNNMSHDIRTPMNAIIGFTSLAITHSDKPEILNNYLQKIMISSNHLLSLINDVLDMSRIESGNVTIKEVECSLPTLMHDLRSILQSDIKAKNFNFYIDTVDVDHENIFCDKLRLNQILLNLLGNSMKFTPPGGTVGVKVVEENTAPEGYADFKFIVFDTGIGMSEKFMEKIFKPFSREENSTVSGIQGTGLGLAITKNIVSMMGGSIDVKSEKNKGSEFTVSLRLHTSNSQKKIEVIKKLENMRALVADDSADTCVSVARMLKTVGMRSEWTTLGKEAVLRAKVAKEDGDSFKVYIIDWLMPDMNGIEVVRRVRQVIGNDIPIIIMTAYDWSDIEEEAMEAGVTAFCAKPIFLSELYDILVDLTATEKAATKVQTLIAEDTTDYYKGKRVLLVEDVELNREIATTIMEELGLIVECAENGQIGVDMVKSADPGYYDMVCMDLMMPIMDGYEATRAIRSLEDKVKANIPIVAMTANAFEEDKEKAIECGMNDFLTKPFRIDQLLDMLKTHLQGDK